MRVRQVAVGPMQNFVYLLIDERSGEAVAIDSGWEIGPIVKAAEEAGISVKYAFATHSHFDHVETLPELAGKLGCPVLAHRTAPIKCDRRVEGGEVLKVGGSELTVIHTPGHTEDSICLYDGANLLTGDTLFVGSCGRTDLPGGSVEKLYHSLHKVIMELPEKVVVYPGHDYGDVPSRTLEEEARVNPALTASSLEEFAALFG